MSIKTTPKAGVSQAQVAAKVGCRKGSNMQAHRVCVARNPHSSFQNPVGVYPDCNSVSTCEPLSAHEPTRKKLKKSLNPCLLLSFILPRKHYETLFAQLTSPTQSAVESAAAQLLLASNPFLYL